MRGKLICDEGIFNDYRDMLFCDDFCLLFENGCKNVKLR